MEEIGGKLFGPWACGSNLKNNIQPSFMDWLIDPQVNATEPHQWYANIG